MNWKELAHEDGHVLIEYADGSRLNISYNHLIEMHDPEKKAQISVEPLGPQASPFSMLYRYKKGAVLSEHSHDEMTLHDVYVFSGRVIVHRAIGGDVEACEGDMVNIAVGERHSIEALEESATIHTLVNI